MRSFYFSENAYPYLPDASDYASIRNTLPSKLFDPKIGADLYHRYFDEWAYADEVGLNVMVNEHHSTATNLNPSGAVVLAVLARITKKAQILMLGLPIANRRDPVRVAEEMAMIDNYSRGRLEVGFVRGVPYEVSAQNSNPMRMAERMKEAHDLILKAWTTHDGPFNWEGRYFQHRQVNIWPRPYQQPRPPVWITCKSPSQIDWVADEHHIAATFLTGYGETKRIFDHYRERRMAGGHPMPGNDRFAYAALTYVGDTDDEGFAGAEKLMWYLNANKVSPQFKNPPGYSSVGTSMQMMRGASTSFDRSSPLATCIEQGIVFAGSPDTVYKQIRKHHDETGGYGNILMMGQAGFLEHDETMKSIKLLGTEVAPRLAELSLNAQAVPA
jgi:alkanesulfonate monooxygenase SsuD/methylene tetrahydromethanopterin reductase-like flavin-dependent oxidoreductase (luciferase family)